MIRRIAVLMTVLTLTSATSALATTTDDGGCTLVGGHAEAAPKGSEGQKADAPTVKDPTGLCNSVAGLRGGS